MKIFTLFLLCLAAVFLVNCGDSQATVPASGATSENPDAYTSGEPSLARSFYFVFDDSGSMGSRPPNVGIFSKSDSRIEIAKRATLEFLKFVPEDVNLGLYALNLGECVPLGLNNREAFIREIKRFSDTGGTPLNNAIRRAVDILVEQRKKQLDYGDFRIIVVTDGEATDGDIGDNAGPYALKARIPIYTIGFCVNGDHALRRYSLNYRAADNEEDLRKGLEETLGESATYDASTFGK